MYGIVWSVCLVWPDGTCWADNPRMYCGCLLEFIKKRRGDTVIVYLHEAVAHLVEPIFRNVKGRVYLRRVSRKYDAFMPQSMRFAPFFSAADPVTRSKLVIVADIHDDFRVQNRLVKRVTNHMREHSKGVGLTMWRAAGNGMPHHCDALAALNVRPRFFVESSEPGEYHWHIDGGLLISSPKCRSLFPRAVDIDFEAHVDEFYDKHGHIRDANEQVLETYIHRHRKLSRLFCDAACAFPHQSTNRSCHSCSTELNFCTSRHRKPSNSILLEGNYENENSRPFRHVCKPMRLIPR